MELGPLLTLPSEVFHLAVFPLLFHFASIDWPVPEFPMSIVAAFKI